MSGDLCRDGGGAARSGRGSPVGGRPALPAVSGVCCARSAAAGPAPRHRRRCRRRDAPAGPRSDCHVTQILLPTELTVRRADSTEAIGSALGAQARGAGHRSIAARFGRPESTVRRWLRGVPDPHAQWLYRRGVDRAAAIDRELLVRPAPQRTALGHALNLLAGAACATGIGSASPSRCGR